MKTVTNTSIYTPSKVHTLNFDVKRATDIPQNLQIIVFIKNQFTLKISIDGRLIMSQNWKKNNKHAGLMLKGWGTGAGGERGGNGDGRTLSR